MEYVKCPNCGKQTPAMLSRCHHCGAKLDKIDENLCNTTEPRFRNGFTSFWLRLSLIINVVIGSAYFFTIFSDKGLWSAYDPMWTRIYGFIGSAILAFGYLLLIRWRKFGFTVIALLEVVNIPLNAAGRGFEFSTVVSPIMSVAILFAILQIKKNGKTCWNQLY